ncbi:MAG TPA: S53 family peptidase [Polyangia bacterium]|nr:S53 family peptidase [Polyangia bacterium]
MRGAIRSFLAPAAVVAAYVVSGAAAPAARAASDPAAAARDLGPSSASQTITASLVLKVRHPDGLERAVATTQDPKGGAYHRFLSLPDFVAQYAPSAADITSIQRYLASFGVRVTEVYADQLVLKATGTVDAFSRAFGTDVHDYASDGRRFHRPRRPPAIPILLRDLLLVVEGLSDQALFHPMNVHASVQAPLPRVAAVLPASGSTATGVPGSYTVGDVANLYDINPLYRRHLDGSGRTVGVATLANFIPDDAYAYWRLIGLDVKPNRIKQVHVDGGGPLGADAGSGETSLDVEQAGGLAPRAKIVVYDAPNTDAGFIDLFYKAASDNVVDSLSVSWGSAEEFYASGVAGVDLTGEMLALHQAFLEAAVQGISLFAASGDSGAYDANLSFNQPFSNVLSVDIPAADPAITGGGGTTTPFTLNAGEGTPNFVVSTERVWGWDYVQDYLVEVLGPTYQNALFPFGGGGGVSTFWPLPSYQAQTNGIRLTQPGQSVVYDDGSGSGPQDLLALPAHFPGRNVPDVSLNADPYSGFVLYSTEDGGVLAGYGGTSFVSPQLNGVSALLAQAAGGRIGLWNPMLYRFANAYAYAPSSPVRDIAAGDNWFYQGRPGYEPGAGLGVLDVANLAAAMAREQATSR